MSNQRRKDDGPPEGDRPRSEEVLSYAINAMPQGARDLLEFKTAGALSAKEPAQQPASVDAEDKRPDGPEPGPGPSRSKRPRLGRQRPPS